MIQTTDTSERENLTFEQRCDKARYYAKRGDKKQSWRRFSELLLEKPDSVPALLLAGEAMAEDYPGLAGQLFARALVEEPGNADALNNVGHCLGEMHPDLAKKYFEAARAQDPNSIEVMINLCSAACQTGDYAECVKWSDEVLKVDPSNRQGRGNGSLARLALGDWEKGWQDYHCLLGHKERKEQNYTVGGHEVSRWDGKSSPTDNLVVYGEQGIGDEVMFLSMLPESPPGDAGYIECISRTEGLFRRSFPNWTVKGTRLEPEKTWPAEVGITDKLEMGGLGQFFGGGNPFRRGRYLESCPVRRGTWREEFALNDLSRKPVIGLAWTGGNWKNGRAWRSISPNVLRDLIDAHPDVNFVSLEYLPHEPVEGVTSYPWASGSQDIDDVAALIDSMDLVISVTTSAVDIAGGLGKECWALAPKKTSWRYGVPDMGDQMHFYESVKVYRQENDMDWTPVVKQVSDDLAAWKAKR